MDENLSNDVNEVGDKKQQNKVMYYFKEWIMPIIIAIVLATLINKFCFFFIKVPTGSMEPTIMPNDKIIVTRVYNKQKLKRGDIVVFYSKEITEEKKQTTNLVKRLIGLPGDKIKIEESGDFYINDKKYEEPYVIHQSDMSKEFEVPEGKYLFLGDNRANSKDARMWQNPYISEDDIMGKARVVILPFSRFGKLK